MNRLIRGSGTRHFCPDGHRVYPYDGQEILTCAPLPGRKGGEVLLSSYNSRRRRDGEPACAWCWECQRWVETRPRARGEYVLDYLRRESVRIRTESSNERGRKRELLRRVEQRLHVIDNNGRRSA